MYIQLVSSSDKLGLFVICVQLSLDQWLSNVAHQRVLEELAISGTLWLAEFGGRNTSLHMLNVYFYYLALFGSMLDLKLLQTRLGRVQSDWGHSSRASPVESASSLEQVVDFFIRVFSLSCHLRGSDGPFSFWGRRSRWGHFCSSLFRCAGWNFIHNRFFILKF